MSEIIRSIEAKQLRSDLPAFGIGDNIRVWVKVVEGNRERLQAFEGTVIAKRNGEDASQFIYPTVDEGIEGVKFVHAVIESAANNSKWVEM